MERWDLQAFFFQCIMMGKMIDNFGVVALGLHQDFLCLKGPLPIPAMHSAPYMVRKWSTPTWCSTMVRKPPAVHGKQEGLGGSRGL